MRCAVVQFLRPELLRKYVRKMDEEVRQHIEFNWVDHKTVKVKPLVKSLTFDIICFLVFGQERGPIREALAKDFEDMVNASLSIAVNIPFTMFNKGMKATARIWKVLTRILPEKKAMLEQGNFSSCEDFITYLLRLDAEGTHPLAEEEIVNNAMLLLTAGHETSAVLITFMICYLVNEPDAFARIADEQEEVARNKASGNALTWDDLAKMMYTWRAALETLRMVPPVFAISRTALKDIMFEGCCIL